MEQAESNLDSLRVFTTEKWFVQLGMAARGIACCFKSGTSGRIAMQVSAFKLPACSRVTGNPEVISSSVGLVPTNALVLTGLANFRVVDNSELIQDWPRKLTQYRNLMQAGKSQAAGAAPGRNS
jgi:hypothetical protein